MNDSNKRASGGGIGFCGLLAIAFIVLKLCGVINWSWGLVLAPIWVPIVAIIIFTTVLVLFKMITKR